ncbi:hypothetical protein KW843_22835 [Acidovorax sp. sif1233]|uniref:hypothetical protein n=1 Tax=Acidovorax sp. sif1233 TaxID=2854792 RepID=UPI001C47ED04|nr:hypothetical protein [Acidovorax sp. sif1233]MBV7457335.1 hypothetical protein [Acidovorax sp. sif1233]
MSREIATMADEQLHGHTGHEADQQDTTVRKLFLVLHGKYGNVFAGKFATGELNEAGKDKGVLAALRVWSAALAKYPGPIIELAAERLKATHPEYPPSLPQFEKLCDAAMPRQTVAELEGWKRLPAPEVMPVDVQVEPRCDGKDWARRIVARAVAGDRSVSCAALRDARLALGLEGRMSWQ